MTTHAQADDFDVGKAIFDQLKDLPHERQQRVLRWVAEALGVTLGALVEPAPQPAGSPHPPQMFPVSPPASPATDIKTFVAAKAPKSDTQFAAAVAYFYRFDAPPAERRDSIDGVALQEAARLAGRRRLSNPRATLHNAKAAGYLDSSTRGEFTINSVGENLVAMTLPGGGDSSTRKTTTRRGKPTMRKGKTTTRKGKTAPRRPKASATAKTRSK